MSQWKQTAKLFVLALVMLIGMPAIAGADHSQSATYQVNETFFGSGGELNACSATYCSKQSTGELAVGQTASTGYKAQAGFNTDRSAYLEVSTSTTNINLGTLSTNAPTTASASFTVKSYLSHGYTVANASDGPSNNGYNMATITIPTGSIPGTEQFGMNMRANTSPVAFGADPVQHLAPDNTFGFGYVPSNPGLDYNSPDFFRYVKNDSIAQSDKSSSDTTFTISYLFNISPVTPGGTYVFHHVLVVTATF